MKLIYEIISPVPSLITEIVLMSTCHNVVNRLRPITGKVISLKNSKYLVICDDVDVKYDYEDDDADDDFEENYVFKELENEFSSCEVSIKTASANDDVRIVDMTLVDLTSTVGGKPFSRELIDGLNQNIILVR